MIRSITRWCVLGTALCLAPLSSAAGQGVLTARPRSLPASATAYGELRGIIRDNEGRPLTGAVISALGSTAVFALSDREGRYTFRNLLPGAYLVRAHLDGYAAPRGQYVQVNAGGRESWTISLSRVATAEAPVMLSAGIGGAADPPAPAPDADAPDTGELAWRLRHLKRGVLKDEGFDEDGGDLSLGDSRGGLGRAVGPTGRAASSLLADLTLNGQINLLTTTSFDRPQDLLSTEAGAPRPVAYLSVVAPASNGEWAVRGSITQGDIASWILAGSFRRTGSVPHLYEIGASYATQRYQGGNAEALAAMSEGSRNAGELSAADTWTITPQWVVSAGGKYATYGYLTDRALLSGRMRVVYQPSRTDPLRLSVSASHREIAPGAEEFVPPTVGLWLPPERTFSEIAQGSFRPERLNQVEIAGEREIGAALVLGVRAFRQQVEDQLVTVFGDVLPGATTSLGHYHVGTAGDFEGYGWGVSLTRAVSRGTEASIIYTALSASPYGTIEEADALLRIAPALLRQAEQIHDLTATVRSRVDATATRVFVVYKLNSAYTQSESPDPLPGGRFELQINQEMPFLNFTGASWEMLLGVRNLFRSDLFDGSVYDELMVLRAPKRVMGGVTVRF